MDNFTILCTRRPDKVTVKFFFVKLKKKEFLLNSVLRQFSLVYDSFFI